MASLSNRHWSFGISHWVIGVLLFFCGRAFAQVQLVQITVNVLPPYSAYLQDYAGAGQQVRIFVRNTTQCPLRLRLTGTLTGDNGVVIATSANYRPPLPLQLAPNENRLLTRADLEGLFDLGQIDVQGMDKNTLYRGLPLPDGNYQLCVRAFSEGTPVGAGLAPGCVNRPPGQPLSAEFPIGCSAPIVVKAVEPPILIAPLCDAQVVPTVPQAVVFTWTPPAGVSPAQVEYTLRVVELPDNNIDPNVFIDAIVLPKTGVEIRNLRTSTFLYGPTQPPLQLGKRYAWRVQAIDRWRKLNFLNDGKAPVCAFTYGSPQTTGITNYELAVGKPLTPTNPPSVDEKALATVPDPKTTLPVNPPTQQVMSGDAPAPPPINCNTEQLPIDKKAVTASIDGKTLKIGAFELAVFKASLQGTSFSGEGRVSWNKAPIKVTFKGIKVNAAGQVFEGLVSSSSDGPGMPAISLGQIDAYGGLPNNYFDQIKTNLIEAGKQTASVPLPLKYDAKLGTVGVNQMLFSPTGAQMDLVLGVAVPEANLNLFLAATNVCMNPEKTLPNTATLYLVKDFPLPIPGGIGQKLVFKKSDAPKINGTYASIVNGDFTKVHGVLNLNLGSSILKLDDGSGGIKAGDVVGTITTDFDQWADWYGIVNLPAFQVPGIKGLTFTGKDVVYDHSDKTNAPGCTFPTEYSGDKGNTFRGLYFKDLMVELPGAIKSNPRIGVKVNGGVIDEAGFTGLIKNASTPILDYNKNTLAGFGFSVDDLNVLVVQNSYRGGGMNGKLQFPISNDPFSYTCTLSKGFDDVQFTAIPKDGYNVPLFAANMDLNDNTAITVSMKSGQKAKVSMSLYGQVAIDVKKFAGSGSVGQALDATIPKLYFEKFTLSNAQQSSADKALGGSGLFINTGDWSLTNDVAKNSSSKGGKGSGGPANPDDYLGFPTTPPDETQPGTLAGFPIDFDPPTMVSGPKGTGVRLGIGIHLGEASEDASFVQAHGSLDILGDVKIDGGRFKPVYNGAYPTSISLTGGIGLLKVSGGLDFFYDHSTYGNGLKGNAKVDIPTIGSGISMVMLFGKKSYHYAFLDANVQFAPGISMVGPLMLMGFGGGMHYNMSMSGTPASIANSTTPPAAELSNPGKTSSGVVYTPSKGSWGITARVLVGLADVHVFNSSLELAVNFKGGGFNSFSMTGKAAVISKSGDPLANDGVINGMVSLAYTPGAFDLGIDVDATLVGMKVKVPFGMHFASSGDWFVKLGDPYDVNRRVAAKLLDINGSVVSAHLNLSGYVAAGTVFNSLPPLPEKVVEFLQKPDADSKAKNAYASRSSTYPKPTSIGKNFSLLFGGRVEGDLKVQVMPFRCSASALVGIDAGLQRGIECGEGGPPAGIQGWYGTGQGYAYFNGGIDLFVDVWFFEGSVNIMDLTAAVLFKGGMMNPTWAKGDVRIKGSALDGLVSVDTRQDFSMGDVCTPVFAGDPLADIEIIQDMVPASGTTDVSVRPILGTTFNMPVDKTFTVLIPTGEIRKYAFKVETPQLFVMKSGVGPVAVAATEFNPIQWSPDKRAFTLAVKSFLPSYAKCLFKTDVVIKELVNGFWQDPYIDKLKKREPRSQSKTVNFTLGKQPDNIPLDVVDISWPLPDQHYFLKKQVPQGFVRALPTATFKGLDVLKADPAKEWVALFIEPGGNTLSSPMLFDGDRKITFNLPAGLKNSQVYRLELRRRNKSGGASSNPANLLTTSYKNTLYAGIKYEQTSFNASALQAIKSADGSNMGQELFGLVFRTSQYNTFAEKINDLQLVGDYIQPSVYGPNGGLIALNTKPNAELFDDFELVGGPVYPNSWYQPAIWYKTPLGSSKYDQELKKRVYDVIQQWSSDGGEYFTDCCQYNPKYGSSYPGDKYDVECWYTLEAENLLSCDRKRNTSTLVPSSAMFPIIDVAPKSGGSNSLFQATSAKNGTQTYQYYGTSPTKGSGPANGWQMQGEKGASSTPSDPRFSLSPLETGVVNKFIFERDRLMQLDLEALMRFLDQLQTRAFQALNDECVGYVLNKQCSWETIQKRYKELKQKTQPDQMNQTNSSFTVNSKSLSLYGRFYLGRFFNKKQWQLTEDSYYNLSRIDYDDMPVRGKSDGFEVIFKYSLESDEELPGSCRSEKGLPEFPVANVSKLFYLNGQSTTAKK